MSIERIEVLVAADKLEQAITELRADLNETDAALGQELVQHQASLARCAADQRRGLLPWDEAERIRTRVRYAVLELLGGLKTGDAAPSKAGGGVRADPDAGATPRRPLPTVFISYSHVDGAVAHQLKTALRERGFDVRIDSDTLQAGEDIATLIRRSIRETDATLCVVSRNSLLSSWVAMEVVHTLQHENWARAKKLIACYLDPDFLDPGFRLEATERIDGRIKELDELIPRYVEQRIDTNDLNQDKSRLFELRNNLGAILQRLRGSLCLDVREPEFARSVGLILQTLEGR